jgi:hypothetical protein
MSKGLRCHCEGTPECQLCRGTGYYDYQPGPRGWIPFRCPTCEGEGRFESPAGERETCVTCLGAGTVDPAMPAFRGGVWGYLGYLCGIFLGGGGARTVPPAFREGPPPPRPRTGPVRKT